MNSFGFGADQKITDVLAQNKFTLSAEIVPPRNGTDSDKILSRIESLVQAGSQFLSVTKGAGGSLRAGSLPIAQLIKERFKVPCIAHFTCRDLIPSEVENQLIDHHYFGIRNILALRGDPPQDQPDWIAQPGSHKFAYQLIEQIRALNGGTFLSRPSDVARGGAKGNKPNQNTDFCIGAAVYPEHPDEGEADLFFRKKVEAGAHFAITQMIYDVECFSRFQDRSQGLIPILPGIQILKSQEQAVSISHRFKISIPKWMMQALPEKSDTKEFDRILDIFLKYSEQLRMAGAPGIHFFVLFDTQLACGLLNELRLAEYK